MSAITLSRITGNALTVAGLATLAACGTESVSAPSVARVPLDRTSLVTPTSAATTIKVCKTGPAGTYSFSFPTPSGNTHPSDVQNSGSTFTLTVVSGAPTPCKTIYTRTESDNAQTDAPASLIVTEAAASGTTLASITATGGGGSAAGGGGGLVPAPVTDVANRRVTLYINAYHNATATFNNAAAPTFRPLRSCNYTQGFYKNHASDLTATLQFGRDNGSIYVTSSGPLALVVGTKTYTTADLLTLYGTPPKGDQNIAYLHQLVTAELNLIATGAAPQAVRDEITSRSGNTDLLDTYNNTNHCD